MALSITAYRLLLATNSPSRHNDPITINIILFRSTEHDHVDIDQVKTGLRVRHRSICDPVRRLKSSMSEVRAMQTI